MRQYRPALCISVFMIAMSCPLAAQTPAPSAPTSTQAAPATDLALDVAIQRALAAHLDLSIAQSEIAAAHGALVQGGAHPNPELSLSVEDTRRQTRTTAVMLTQPLELGGKRSARIGVAEQGLELARSELAAKRAEVRAQVIAGFFDALIAQERVALARRSLDLAGAVAESTGKRVTAGKLSPVEEARARVAEAAARVELAQAEGEARMARQRLAAIWGESVPRFERLVGPVHSLPALPMPAALDARLTSAPQLRLAEIEVKRRQAMVQVERARAVPDMSISLGVQRSEELGRNQLLLGLAIPLPVFDRNRGGVTEALRREDIARDALTAARLRLASEALQARERLATALTEEQSLRGEVLPSARSALEAATRGFELGKFAFLDVLDAQRTLFQAESQHLRAVAEAHRAASDIDRLLGEVQ